MMKRMETLIVIFLFLAAAGLWIHFGAGTTFAAEEAPQWRGTYDIIMRWLNFLILAGVIVKFSRTPLANFLKHRREETQAEIDLLEEEKGRLKAQVSETIAAGKVSSDRLVQLKERIVTQGKQKRRHLIEDAKRQRNQMLEDTRRKVGGLINAARREVADNLIDTAFDMAVKRLPGEIADTDNVRFIEEYMQETRVQG
jgi:F-type H+-transporting ATPase subunit b